jgi:hypothetical protein
MKEPRIVKSEFILKKCPYCDGRNPQMWEEGDPGAESWYARCPDCIARGPTLESQQAAAEAWNKAPRRVVAEELDHAYKLGISSGLEQAARTAMDLAADNFKRGEDAGARLLRELSETFSTTAETERPPKEN